MCDHGYEDLALCPRCMPRDPGAPATEPGDDRWQRTRWSRTDTTAGPLSKLLVSALLAGPAFHGFWQLTQVRTQGAENAFAVLWFAPGVVASVALLPRIWEPGRRRTPQERGR